MVERTTGRPAQPALQVSFRLPSHLTPRICFSLLIASFRAMQAIDGRRTELSLQSGSRPPLSDLIRPPGFGRRLPFEERYRP
jgi:hypothetical protein